jgi:hypothetical protein
VETALRTSVRARKYPMSASSSRILAAADDAERRPSAIDTALRNNVKILYLSCCDSLDKMIMYPGCIQNTEPHIVNRRYGVVYIQDHCSSHSKERFGFVWIAASGMGVFFAGLVALRRMRGAVMKKSCDSMSFDSVRHNAMQIQHLDSQLLVASHEN